MFTGIIEELGAVESIQSRAAGARLKIHCQKVLEDMTEGASIAVNGVCLTAVDMRAESFSADLAPGDSAAQQPGRAAGAFARQPGAAAFARRAASAGTSCRGTWMRPASSYRWKRWAMRTGG